MFKAIETSLRRHMLVGNTDISSFAAHFLQPLAAVSSMSFYSTPNTGASVTNELYKLMPIYYKSTMSF